jgi:hypothetical protein
MDISHFDHCLESCEGVIESYREMEEKHIGGFGKYDDDEDYKADAYRFKPLV